MFNILRPPWGVCEAHLNQAYISCATGAMTSHTHAMGMFDGGLLKLGLKETTTIHSHGFVMVLLQWHKV